MIVLVGTDDRAVIDAIAALQPNASGVTIGRWLDANRPRPWWKFWGWTARGVYGCLARLEARRLISSGWERKSGWEGPRRRVYAVVRP